MEDYTNLHQPLIAWFQQHKADLPWRQVDDPYAVWLSEIMLQQTQVTTVIPYYHRFLERFPTVEELAAAPLEDVLKLWEGLGYYSRARNLHRTAKIVADEMEGQFPSTVDELLKLPGVGRYTGGAVACFAFNADVPVVDGNVVRVLTRLFDYAEDVGQTAAKKEVWAMADEILPARQAADWNEGLMELGRVICIPRAPRCDECPVVEHCQAHQNGTQVERPVKAARKPSPHYDVTAAVISGDDGQILIAQRPLDGMLGGLWEFPGGKREESESLPDCLKREIREELGIEIEVGGQLITIKHSYTHFHITLYAYLCTHVSGNPQALECDDWAWIKPDELDQYPFPVTDQKIIDAIRKGGGQLSFDLNV